MTAKQQPSPTDFSNMQTDIALLKQFNEKVAEPTFKDIQDTQKEIKDALVSLDHVKQQEFNDYKVEVDKRFRETNRRRWVQTTFAGVGCAVISSLATAIVLSWWMHK